MAWGGKVRVCVGAVPVHPSFLPSPQDCWISPSLATLRGSFRRRTALADPLRPTTLQTTAWKCPLGKELAWAKQAGAVLVGREGASAPPAALGCLAEMRMQNSYKSAHIKRHFHLEGMAAKKSFSITSPPICVTSLTELKSFFLLRVHLPPPAIPSPSGLSPASLSRHWTWSQWPAQLPLPQCAVRGAVLPTHMLPLTTAVRIFSALHDTYHIKGWLTRDSLTDMSLGQSFSVRGPFCFGQKIVQNFKDLKPILLNLFSLL